jgi:transcriptional regulator with XRE-family HTH domain
MTTKTDVLKELAKRLKAADGHQTKVAQDLGVSKTYLNDVVNGRRDPGTKLLNALGFTKEVSYRRIKE